MRLGALDHQLGDGHQGGHLVGDHALVVAKVLAPQVLDRDVAAGDLDAVALRLRQLLALLALPLDRGPLGALRLEGVTVHLDAVAHLALVERLRLCREDGRLPNEHVHYSGGARRALGVVRRTGVLALVLFVHAGEQERPIGHHHDVLHLVGLQQALVLRPGDVLQLGAGLDVALDHAGQLERQVLHRGRERDLGGVCGEEGEVD